MRPLSLPLPALAACALALLLSAPLAYAPPPVPRLALVIGNSKHQDPRLGALRTARHDAEDVAKGLGLSGYQVASQFDADLAGLRRALDAFARQVSADSTHQAVAVVYFAGYGLQKGGRNFLLPTGFDAGNESQNLDQSAIAVDRDIITALSGRGGGANVIILDACHDDPFGQRQGLAQFDAIPNGTLVALAAEPNTRSVENADPKAPERNGVYAKQLLMKLEKPNPDLDIRRFFDMVGNNVYESSGKAQKPRLMTAKTPPALPEKLALAAENLPRPAAGQDLQSWQRVAKSTETCAFEHYLKRFPDGAFADNARAAIQAISAKDAAAPRAFADLPQELKAQVTRSFQAKQAAAAAECARKWAAQEPGSKAYRQALPRRPRSGLLAAAWTASAAWPARRTGLQAADWEGVEGRMARDAGPRMLALATEDETDAGEEKAGAAGDQEFQTDLSQAGQGEINAMYRVALVYEEGSHGVDQDETEMLHWLSLSSALGNGLASYKLYRFFAAQDSGYAKAVKFKSLASRQGYYGPVTLEAER